MPFPARRGNGQSAPKERDNRPATKYRLDGYAALLADTRMPAGLLVAPFAQAPHLEGVQNSLGGRWPASPV